MFIHVHLLPRNPSFTFCCVHKSKNPGDFGTYHVLYILCLYDDIGKLNTYDENMNYCFKRRQEVWVLEIVILLSN